MKKPYQKPVLMYESFELSTSIAAGCEIISNADWMSCPVTVPGLNIIVFGSKSAGCVYESPEPDSMVCYHVPKDECNVFSS
ncbi:MAG: hypothetical protein MJ118_03540 [Clostridia bacterium]|nr:hypothetical protein [Clostridia bacterium]